MLPFGKKTISAQYFATTLYCDTHCLTTTHNDHCRIVVGHLLLQFLVDFDPFLRSRFRCPQHQPVSNLLVSESLLQFEGVKESPKSRMVHCTKDLNYVALDDFGKPAK